MIPSWGPNVPTLYHRTVINTENGTNQLQKDLSEMTECSKARLMRSNAKKCYVQTVKKKHHRKQQLKHCICGSPMHEVKHHDQYHRMTLNGTEHIDQTTCIP